MFKRVFLVVMDSVGVGEAPDAEKYGDKGANTLLHTMGDAYNLNVLEKLSKFRANNTFAHSHNE